MSPKELEVAVDGTNQFLGERTSGSEALHCGEPGMETQSLIDHVQFLVKDLDNVDEFSNNERVERHSSEHQQHSIDSLNWRLGTEVAIPSRSYSGKHEVTTVDELLEVGERGSTNCDLRNQVFTNESVRGTGVEIKTEEVPDASKEVSENEGEEESAKDANGKKTDVASDELIISTGVEETEIH